MTKKETKETKIVEIGKKPIIKEEVKRNVALEIIVMVVACMLIFLLTYASRFVVSLDNNTLIKVGSLLIYVGFIIVSIVALVITKQTFILRIEKKKLWMQFLWAVILATILIGLISILPYLIFEGINFSYNAEYVNYDLIYKAVYYILFVGVGEELFFRGYLQNQIGRFMGKLDYFAPLIVGLLFGLLHLFNGSWEQAIITSLMGVVFGYMKYYVSSCSLLSVIGAHGLYDFALQALKIVGI